MDSKSTKKDMWIYMDDKKNWKRNTFEPKFYGEILHLYLIMIKYFQILLEFS